MIRVIITGGHHTSALPVIKELKSRGVVEIFWIGHKYPPLEYREIKKLEIPFYELKAGKVYKSLSLVKWIHVPLGFLQALGLVLKLKPDVILSFGGYLAAPVVFAGWLVGVPSITHEQTVVVGFANKFISVFAKKILISWEQSQEYFPRRKVVYSGLPLRKEIFEVRSDSFEINENLPTIYVTAGKTGSHAINQIILECMDELLNFANIIHQTGYHTKFKDFHSLNKKAKKLLSKPGKYFARRFVEGKEIGEILHKANLIFGRSGAHTIAEIVALRKPALLVPISWVSHNEQYKNAEVVRDFGLGEILEEKDLTKENLVDKVKEMLGNLSRYMPPPESLPAGFVPTNAAKIIVDELFSVAKAKTSPK